MTRVKWLAGLATLALAGTSSGVAPATGTSGAAPKAPTVGVTRVKVTLVPPTHVVKFPHRFAVVVDGHAAKVLTLDWWFVRNGCARTEREEEGTVPIKHSHGLVDGNFAEKRVLSTTDRVPPPRGEFSRGSMYHSCAYLSEGGHTVASAGAGVSWRVE